MEAICPVLLGYKLIVMVRQCYKFFAVHEAKKFLSDNHDFKAFLGYL